MLRTPDSFPRTLAFASILHLSELSQTQIMPVPMEAGCKILWYNSVLRIKSEATQLLFGTYNQSKGTSWITSWAERSARYVKFLKSLNQYVCYIAIVTYLWIADYIFTKHLLTTFNSVIGKPGLLVRSEGSLRARVLPDSSSLAQSLYL